MKWQGIKRNSIDIGKDAGEGLLAINTRFKVAGELRRRRGLARTSIQRKNAGVTTINGFSAFQSNVMAALTDGDRIQGYQQPYSLWGDNPDYSASTGGSAVFDMTYSSGQLVNLITSGQLAGDITPSDATGITSSSIHELVINTAKEPFGYTNKSLSYTSAEAILEADISATQPGYQITMGTQQCGATMRRNTDGTYRATAIGRFNSIDFSTTAFASGTHIVRVTNADGALSLYIDEVLCQSISDTITPLATETYYPLLTQRFTVFTGTSAIIRYGRIDLT
jgi:hypothetical protein